MAKRCPACGNEVVSAMGRADSDFLAIEEYPHMIFNPPLQGNDIPPSKIFRKELAKAGFNIHQFRIISVYPHLLGENEMDERCWSAGMNVLVSGELPPYKGILVFGNALCSELSAYKLDEVMGLTGISHRLTTDAPVMFLPSIKTVYSQGAGELQLGLKRFAKLVGVKIDE